VKREKEKEDKKKMGKRNVELYWETVLIFVGFLFVADPDV
jgi:hypothetical protein